MIPPVINFQINQKEKAFFAEVLTGGFRAAALFFAIMIALSKNQQNPQEHVRRLRKISHLIKKMGSRLKRDPKVRELEALYKQKAQSSVVTRLLISFWGQVFGITMQELCQMLN